MFLINPNRNIARIFEYYPNIEKYNNNNKSYKGWVQLNGCFEGLDIEQVIDDGEKKYPFYWKNFFKRDFYAKNTLHIEKMFQIAQRYGVDVVVITPPVFESFSRYINIPKYNLMQNTINQLNEKYHFEYINLFTDERFEMCDFFNHNHVNKEGARKLSEIVNNEIIKKQHITNYGK